MLATAAAAASGCEPDASVRPLFLELDGAEERLWLTPRGPRPQARGQRAIGRSGQALSTIRYSLLGRQAAFLFTEGDVVRGYPWSLEPGSLLGAYGAWHLPAVRAGEAERRLSADWLPALGLPAQVTSFRVYDQGQCSALQPWQPLVERMAEQMQRQLEARENLSGVRVGVTLVPFFQSDRKPEGLTGADAIRAELVDDPLGPTGVPRQHDGFTVTFDIFIGKVYLPIFPDCHDEHIRVGATVEIERTDYALSRLALTELVFPCIEAGREPPPDELPDVSDPVLRGFLEQCPADKVVELPHFGRVRIADIDYVRTWKEIVAAPEASEYALLVGLRDVEGQPVGAHDPLLRVRRLWSEEVDADCSGGFLPDAESKARDYMVRQLPLMLAEQLREQTLLDPVFLERWLLTEVRRQLEMAGPGGDRTRAFGELLSMVSDVSNYEHFVVCRSDADCDASEGTPAFAQADGTWRGARHVCAPRDRRRILQLLTAPLPPGSEGMEVRGGMATLVNTLPMPPSEGMGEDAQPGRICHVQLEPDWVNVRPDGLEVVLLGGVSHRQASLLLGSGPDEQSLLGRLACDADGDGYRGRADDPLLEVLPEVRGPREGFVPAEAYGTGPFFVRPPRERPATRFPAVYTASAPRSDGEPGGAP